MENKHKAVENRLSGSLFREDLCFQELGGSRGIVEEKCYRENFKSRSKAVYQIGGEVGEKGGNTLRINILQPHFLLPRKLLRSAWFIFVNANKTLTSLTSVSRNFHQICQALEKTLRIPGFMEMNNISSGQ